MLGWDWSTSDQDRSISGWDLMLLDEGAALVDVELVVENIGLLLRHTAPTKLKPLGAPPVPSKH